MSSFRSPCVVCGVPCRGETCMSCIKKKSSLTDYCHVCGVKTSRKKGFHTCRECGYKRAADKLRDHNVDKTPSVCICCGKEIPWLKIHKYKKPRYCGTRCQLLHLKTSTKHTKESVLKSIKTLIEKKGSYVSHADVAKELHVSAKVLTKFGIKLQEVNNAYDYGVDMPKVLKGGKTREQYLQDRKEKQQWEYLRKNGLLKSQIGVTAEDIEELRKKIVDYIKEMGHFIPVRQILKHFHIDYDCTWKKCGFDIYEVNKEAGVPKPIKTSYWEREVGKKLKEAFPTTKTQARFAGCVSPVSRYPLRFDFHVPFAQTLIEVDGQQHYDSSHHYWTPEAATRDRAKEAYAKASGKRLIRIPIQPVNTLYERTDAIIKEIQTNGSCKTC